MKKVVLAVLILFAVVWAFVIEPKMLTVAHYKVTPPAESSLRGQKLKIVFASDFHIKKNQTEKLSKIIEKINAQKPDLVLLGGDFVVGDYPEKSLPIEEIVEGFSKINSKYGVYAILGNHDNWYDGERVKKALEASNITILENENAKIKLKNNKYLYISGVEDLMTGKPDLDSAFKNVPSESAIFLTHSPDIFPKNPYKPALTFAGHTHGGQLVLPFFGALIVPSDYGSRFASGFIEENDKKMIVSRGIGTSVLPIRFNCPPEIIVTEIN